MIEAHKPTILMRIAYRTRTETHIELVKANMHKLNLRYPYSRMDLDDRAYYHDKSKFSDEEEVPYTWLTEYHRDKGQGVLFKYPEGMEELVDKAIKYHYEHNDHHPEYYVNIESMEHPALVEMVCDWTAMAQEVKQNNGSARLWADKYIGSKYLFNEDQITVICNAIGTLDRLNA